MRIPSANGYVAHLHIPNSIEYIAERGTRSVAGGSGTTETITVSSNCVAGNTIFLLLGCRDTSTSGISIADTKGNTWTVDKGPLNGNSGLGFIATTRQNAGTLQAGDVVTVTFGTAPTNRLLMLQEFTGLATSSYLDKTANANSSTSTATILSGTTTATANAKELVVAIYVISTASLTSVSYNASGTIGTYKAFNTPYLQANGSNPKALLACWQILSATGTQSATTAIAPSTSYQGMIATYNAAA